MFTLRSFLKDISAEYSILGWHPFSLRSFKIKYYPFLYSLSQLQVSFLYFTTLLKTLSFPLTYLNSLYLHWLLIVLLKFVFVTHWSIFFFDYSACIVCHNLWHFLANIFSHIASNPFFIFSPSRLSIYLFNHSIMVPRSFLGFLHFPSILNLHT